MAKKNQTATAAAPEKVELQIGDRVNFVLPIKFGGQTELAEVVAVSAQGLTLKTVGKIKNQHLELGPVTHYPALKQLERVRTNTWHTQEEGKELAEAKAALEAEAKAKAEADAKAKEEAK